MKNKNDIHMITAEEMTANRDIEDIKTGKNI